MRIFVDMDDILVNLLDEWLIHLNNYEGVTPKTKEDITNWNMRLAYPTLTDSQLYGCLSDAEFWQRVQPVKYAYKYLKMLINEGNEVYVATSSYPMSFWVKTENCLFKHFDFLSPKNVVCINNKSLLNGDVLFDDYHENLRKFRGIKVLRDKPYNRNCDNECFHFRINTWEEFYNIVQELKKVEEPY
jgi:5'(3')-deoxyribonucleotidase